MNTPPERGTCWPPLPLRVAALTALAERCDPDPQHAAQVTRLAAQLFDRMRDLHKLGPPERELLLAAGVLHDIGYQISATSHHKNSARLIEEAELPGFSDRERLMIAALARYHRKAMPRATHRIFSRLEPRERETVRRLAAILRVADGLDRMHEDVVSDVNIRQAGGVHVIEVAARGDATWELWAARRKSDLFEQVYGPVEITTAPATPVP